jgi:hypothetical protein
VQIRPEAEQKLRAGFLQRADQQRDRYAVQLAHAEQLAARFGCGEVAGVFSAEAARVRPAHDRRCESGTHKNTGSVSAEAARP